MNHVFPVTTTVRRGGDEIMALARGDGQIFLFRYATQKAATGWCAIVPRPEVFARELLFCCSKSSY